MFHSLEGKENNYVVLCVVEKTNKDLYPSYSHTYISKDRDDSKCNGIIEPWLLYHMEIM